MMTRRIWNEMQELGAAADEERNGPRFGRRSDGRLERICKHGVGHTVAIDRVLYIQPYEASKETDRDAWWSHGCDGCCAGMERLHA